MKAFALLLLLLLGGCTLPGGAPGGPSYRVTAEFADVLDLVPQAAVKVNDVTVGSVDGIALSGWNARVSLRIDRSVTLPANATAAIRQSSLLGEKYVALAAPVDDRPQGTLADGATIPLSRTTRGVEVEELLGALGMLLNGGGLAQLKTINEELTRALSGHEDVVTDTLDRLDTFLAGLDAQKADIVQAIDALDRFSAHLSQQRQVIASALDSLGPGLDVLAQERTQLTGALTALSGLSTVGTRVVEQSRDDTLATLAALHPLLDQLVRAGDDLPRSLDFLLTYPFPPAATGAVSGNTVRLHATLDLNGAAILANLLTAPPTPAKPATPTLPGLPAVPGITAPLPSPGTPAPSAGTPPNPGNPSGCGLLGILTGCP